MEITRVVTECGCRLAFPTTHVDLAPRELGEALVTGVVRCIALRCVALVCAVVETWSLLYSPTVRPKPGRTPILFSYLSTPNPTPNIHKPTNQPTKPQQQVDYQTNLEQVGGMAPGGMAGMAGAPPGAAGPAAGAPTPPPSGMGPDFAGVRAASVYGAGVGAGQDQHQQHAHEAPPPPPQQPQQQPRTVRVVQQAPPPEFDDDMVMPGPPPPPSPPSGGGNPIPPPFTPPPPPPPVTPTVPYTEAPQPATTVVKPAVVR
jgi:hypothetical protein